MRIRMALAALALAAAAARADTTPRPEDIGTIDGMIKAFYEVVTGPAGQPRDWERDRTLYIKDLRFVSIGPDGKPSIMTHQEFADGAKDLEKRGFFEKEIHRITQRFGPIAHVWSTYESRQTESRPGSSGGSARSSSSGTERWWIASAIWTRQGRERNPIPKGVPASGSGAYRPVGVPDGEALDAEGCEAPSLVTHRRSARFPPASFASPPLSHLRHRRTWRRRLALRVDDVKVDVRVGSRYPCGRRFSIVLALIRFRASIPASLGAVPRRRFSTMKNREVVGVSPRGPVEPAAPADPSRRPGARNRRVADAS